MKVCAIDYFEETVQKFSDKTAIVDGEKRLSFLALKQDCLRLAGKIMQEIGETKNEPIGVFIGKSANAILADLAINYTGNPFLNLDIDMPAERICGIIQKMSLQSIVTENKYLDRLKGFVSTMEETKAVTIITVESVQDSGISDELAAKLESIRNQQIDINPCCILTTSGSTGTPKGIVMPHKNLANYLNWAVTTFGFDENTIDGNLSSTVFDHFVYEIWLMIGTGATLVLLDSKMMLFPIKLLEVLQKEKVNYIFWVPSMMVNVANMDLLSKIKLPYLSLIWFAGEVFPTKQFNYWRRYFPQATFVNLYGPAEITIDCTYYIVDRDFSDDEPLPIGKACKNTEVLVLNENNLPCKSGETGEIYVRSTSVTPGYYNDPEKTSAAYVQNPQNDCYPEIVYKTGDLGYVNEYGEIVFKGRKDSLIKHMGRRIELSEIEHGIISRLKLVKNCCAVYNYDKKEITLVYEHDQDIAVGEFRKELLKLFPKYMIPVKYIRKDVLPKNTNGKIDRKKLSDEVNKKGE